jgi:hypothetical protein
LRKVPQSSTSTNIEVYYNLKLSGGELESNQSGKPSKFTAYHLNRSVITSKILITGLEPIPESDEVLSPTRLPIPPYEFSFYKSCKKLTKLTILLKKPIEYSEQSSKNNTI